MQWDAHCGVLGQKDVLAEFAGQLCRTSMLLPEKGVTRLLRQFLLRGGFGILRSFSLCNSELNEDNKIQCILFMLPNSRRYTRLEPQNAASRFKKKSKHQGSNRFEEAGAFPIYKKGH